MPTVSLNHVFSSTGQTALLLSAEPEACGRRSQPRNAGESRSRSTRVIGTCWVAAFRLEATYASTSVNSTRHLAPVTHGKHFRQWLKRSSRFGARIVFRHFSNWSSSWAQYMSRSQCSCPHPFSFPAQHSELEYLLQSATKSSVWSACRTEPNYRLRSHPREEQALVRLTTLARTSPLHLLRRTWMKDQIGECWIHRC